MITPELRPRGGAAAGLLAVALLGTGSLLGAAVTLGDDGGQRYQVSNDETISRTLRFTGGGDRTIEVRTMSGSIHVSGSSDADVRIDGQRSVRARSDADLRDADAVKLDIAETAGTIEAIVRGPQGVTCGESNDSRWWGDRPRYDVSYDLRIRVPRGTRLRLCTINGGDIRVDDTEGDFTVNNVNGPITMENVRGSGTVETVNGPVRVSFREAPRADSLFKTINGDVSVTFPGGLSADLLMKTFHGGLFTDFDVETLPAAQQAAAERRNGMYVYHSNSFTRVRVGRGGPAHTFETLNGDVRVQRAQR